MATATQDSEDLFRQTFDALNDREFDAFAATHADDVVLHDHEETIHGIDAVVEHEQTLYEAFPDMEYRLEEIVAEGPIAAARWTVTGTHEREFEGIPPTNATIEVPAQGMVHAEDGAITEVWLTYDRLGIMQQLGVVDAPTG